MNKKEITEYIKEEVKKELDESLRARLEEYFSRSLKQVKEFFIINIK